MSGASAIAMSKITNGSVIGQFGRAATRPRTQIILPLDLSSYDPSMKLGFVVAALRERSKTPARRSSSGCWWHSSQARSDFDLGGLWKHVERRDRLDDELILQFSQIACECRRVTRDVNERRRWKINNGFANGFAQPSRRRIDDDGGSGD